MYKLPNNFPAILNLNGRDCLFIRNFAQMSVRQDCGKNADREVELSITELKKLVTFRFQFNFNLSNQTFEIVPIVQHSKS